MSLIPFYVTGFSKGMMTNKKPFLIPDQAWAVLENAYVYRESVLKKSGDVFLGRLRRVLTGQNLGITVAGPPNTITIANIFTTIAIVGEPNAEIEPGSLFISIAAPDTATFTDNGVGGFTVTGAGVQAGSTINYITGQVILQMTGIVGGAAITASINYFPTLPVMGISVREIAAINNDQTIFFDTKYAYNWNGLAFVEFVPGTTWASTDSDFFYTTNYRGLNPYDRIFFETNFINTATNPMRYYDGAAWNAFTPAVDAANFLLTARLIIPYYGRLLALNVFEGAALGAGNNYYQRCRFSQIGDPTAIDAWRSDIFGKGGFLDAPTNEAITGVEFVTNTLIVKFERTTWQLRYVGEYGQPFIWERVSADFGSESSFSNVLFDNKVLDIGDVAITSGNAIGVNRIDLDIPDQIFAFKNDNDGVQRVWGIRDYQKELVYWCYTDYIDSPLSTTKFPNNVLVYNYRNNTWANFRSNVTAFGTFQDTRNVTWDRTDVFWDDMDQKWEDIDSQVRFPSIVKGNSQGFIHKYGYTTDLTQESEELTIRAINLAVSPISITCPDHNFDDEELCYLKDLQFVDSTTFLPIATNLNENIYQVGLVDANTITLKKWDTSTQSYIDNFPFTPPAATSVYIGGGNLTLLPLMNILTKDINIFLDKGFQTKLSYIDFLLNPVETDGAAVSINLFLNASRTILGNLLVGNQNLAQNSQVPFYTSASDYAWFRFYSTLFAQFFSINITYNNELLNNPITHQTGFSLYAIQAWCRPGGRNPGNT